MLSGPHLAPPDNCAVKYSMKCLITGGFGFIGRHLHSALHSLNIPNLPFGSSTDLLRVQDMPLEWFNQFDTIYHLAAIPRVGVSLERPGEVLQNNHDALLRVLEFCRRNPKTKLIFTSSSSVKFASLDKNPYALSKKMGEDMIRTYAETFGIQATSVRFFNVYGPGETQYGKHTTLIRAFKNCVLEGRDLVVNGDGSVKRDYTHVNDVISGLMCVHLEMQRGHHKPLYEIGSGNWTSVKTIAEEFQKGTDLKIIYGPARTGDADITYADSNLWPVGWESTIGVCDYIEQWKLAGCPDD